MNQDIEAVETFIFSGSSQSLSRMMEFWPNILGALGVLFVGWLIGLLVEVIILKVSSKLSRFKLGERSGFTKFLKKAGVVHKPSQVVATFLKGYVIIIFFIAATKILNLTKIEEFLNGIFTYIPNLVIALFIILIGIRFGTTVANIVESTLHLAKSHAAKIVAIFAKYIIIIFSVMAAILELKIAEKFVEILFIGFVSMVAISGGLAFGLGGKEIVHQLLEDIRTEKKGK